jgi:hypothetical protein
MFQHGDRVRIQMTGDDGLPLVRYGFVGGFVGDPSGNDGYEGLAVLFDDDLAGDMVIDLSQIEPVTITNVELRLAGSDLIDDPALRQGLVNLWFAEAEQAGLEIGALHAIGTGVRDSSEGYVLAELMSAGQQYVLRAVCEPNDSDVVRVRADRPNRWDL